MAKPAFSSLIWPNGVSRTLEPSAMRRQLRFRSATTEVLRSLDLFLEFTTCPATDAVVSFGTVEPGRKPIDGGAAIWFVWGDAQRCVACDLYTSSSDNLRAAAQLIRGCVAEFRRGSFAAVGEALAEYTPSARALSSMVTHEHWSLVLGVSQNATPAALNAAYRRRALTAHPDVGGTREQWNELTEAVERARDALTSTHLEREDWSIEGDEEQCNVFADLFLRKKEKED